MREEKAQVNIEYLLVVAGAVIIVTIVALFIKNTAGNVGGVANTSKPK